MIMAIVTKNNKLDGIFIIHKNDKYSTLQKYLQYSKFSWVATTLTIYTSQSTQNNSNISARDQQALVSTPI